VEETAPLCSNPFQRYPIYLALHKILDGTSPYNCVKREIEKEPCCFPFGRINSEHKTPNIRRNATTAQYHERGHFFLITSHIIYIEFIVIPLLSPLSFMST